MNWFKSSQFRVSLFFLAGVMILFGLLGFIVVQQGQRSFTSTVQGIQIQPQRDDSGVVILQVPDLLGQQIRDDQGALHSPRELFVERFENNLLWISLLGVGIALLLGVFITELFLVRPLSRLQRGIKALKRHEFKKEMQPTGLPEFDEVAKSFNELAGELDRAETLRRNLISDTSHELKTPLTALQMQLESMRDGLIKIDKNRVGLLLEHVERLNDLTERLQEYARVRSLATNIEKKSLKLKPLIERAIADITSDLKIAVDIPDSFEVQGDKKLLEQAFSNIVRNVVAHAGATDLSISLKDDQLLFADNGKGVPPDSINHLFERFYRVEGSRNRQHGGLGLGLAIVQEITEAHGWGIRAEENKPKGLKISITIV